MRRVFIPVLVSLWSCMATAESTTEPLKAYRLLSLSVYDELAVVKSDSGAMETVRVGDSILDGTYTFSKIRNDSAIFADETRPGDLVVLHLAEQGKRSRLQRITPNIPENLNRPQPAFHVKNIRK